MKHWRMATKMGLVITVLAATALVIAIVGYLRLGEVNERPRARPPCARRG